MQQSAGGRDVAVRVGAGEDRLHPWPLRLGQILQHIALLVDLTPLEHGGGTERLGHGRVEGLRPIEDHEQAAVGAEAAALQIGQQPLTHGRVLGGAFPHAQGVFLTGDIDAQRDDERRLDADHPSAAASVREGLDETLTVIGFGLSERLQRSLATTNAAESLFSRTRHVKRNVKRWRGGAMVLRWVAAGVLEATTGFRRVNGCKDMPQLVAALRARDAQLGLGKSSEMVA